MSGLRERAEWCVNLGRVANGEFERMAEASTVAWCYRLGLTGIESDAEYDAIFRDYMLSTQRAST